VILASCSLQFKVQESGIGLELGWRLVSDSCIYKTFNPLTAQNTGDLRLAQGTRTSTFYSLGRLEIFISGQWGTVCRHFWDSRDSDVACRQLGYNGAARPSLRLSSNAG